jgi:3-deoxy-D-manno-octulosonic-acid transferase
LRYLYSFLLYLALPFLFLRLLWRSRRAPDYRKRWAERLGFCPHSLDKCIWVHAVSVGESIAAIPLIKALKTQYPNIPLLVTNMTPTGAARVKAALGEAVLQAYIPYDFPDAISRFLAQVNPVICVVMETELWPNLFAGCKNHPIPIVLANARLSAKSAKGYELIGPLTREMLSAIHALAAQGEADAERFAALGLAREKITFTGNLKFDLELPANLAEKSVSLRYQLGTERFIWVAASTHPSEEEIVLAAHKKIREKNPQALLILVPRHPDRFNSVATLVEQQGFKLARRSLDDICIPDTSVYLADTMGELLLMYSVADVAFVAGSFVNIGGHNMLEAAALSKPVITGPSLFNFAEISEKMLSAKGMLKVHDANELAETISHLFADEVTRKKMGGNALQVVMANRGALQKQVELICSSLQI